MRPKLLILGHVDAHGRHGLVADLRAAERLGAEPLPVVTAYSLGKGSNPEVLRPVWGGTIARQLDAALAQEPEAALIGILGRARHVRLVAQQLTNRGPSALVLAPMPSAFDIAPLVNARLFAAIRRCLIPEARAVVLTANNATTLMGTNGKSLDDLRGIGQKILGLGAGAAWIRAIPNESRQIDIFVDQAGSGLLDYQATNEDVETHTSAASLATLLALGTKLRPAVNRAHRQAYSIDRELHPA
tara:strand:+ start:3085 stop:3816 length:732 start_codon:yes stop_codon:yes gene_type:complete